MPLSVLLECFFCPPSLYLPSTSSLQNSFLRIAHQTFKQGDLPIWLALFSAKLKRGLSLAGWFSTAFSGISFGNSLAFWHDIRKLLMPHQCTCRIGSTTVCYAFNLVASLLWHWFTYRFERFCCDIINQKLGVHLHRILLVRFLLLFFNHLVFVFQKSSWSKTNTGFESMSKSFTGLTPAMFKIYFNISIYFLHYLSCT